MARKKNTGQNVQNARRPSRNQDDPPNIDSRRPVSNVMPAAGPWQRTRSKSRAKQAKDRDENAINDNTATAPGTGSARSAQSQQKAARPSKPLGVVAKHFHQKNQQGYQSRSQQSQGRGVREDNEEDEQEGESDSAQHEEGESDGNAYQRSNDQSSSDQSSSDQNGIDEDDPDISLSDSRIEGQKEKVKQFARDLTTSEDVNFHISIAERTLQKLNQKETRKPLSTRDEATRERTTFELQHLQDRREELSKTVAATRRDVQDGASSSDEPPILEGSANKTKEKSTASAPRKSGGKRRAVFGFTMRKNSRPVKTTAEPAQTWKHDPERWYKIRGIIRERKKKGKWEYLVVWDGEYKKGEPWKRSWRPENEVNEEAIDDWTSRKARRELKAKIDDGTLGDSDGDFNDSDTEPEGPEGEEDDGDE